jgi:hypothetical protein
MSTGDDLGFCGVGGGTRTLTHARPPLASVRSLPDRDHGPDYSRDYSRVQSRNYSRLGYVVNVCGPE